LPAYGQDNCWWSNAPRLWQQGEISIDFPNL
jgi:hypothetical protein